MANKDLRKHATGGFDKNPQNINRTGANRKTVSAVNLELEKQGYSEASAEDIRSCYLRLINIDIPGLQKMIASNEQPILVRVVGKAIISGKGFDVIETMLNRTIGKAQQNIDVTSQGEKVTGFTIEVLKSET